MRREIRVSRERERKIGPGGERVFEFGCLLAAGVVL